MFFQHKQDIQGSMFVFCRSVHPYYGFLIQNRKSLSDNVCEYLIDGIEFQRTNLFLLYKTQSSNVSDDARIRSIWFENESGCQRISALLNKYGVVKMPPNKLFLRFLHNL